MAEGVLFNIVEDILKNLGSRALDELASASGFKSQLEKLKNTINTIKDVLQDAEERQLHSHAIRGWLEKLKAVVYVADDLFDELATMASQKEAMGGRKLTKEVKVFFSRSNHIAHAFSISNKIKNIRKTLDEIVKDGSEFAFVLRPFEEQRVVYRQGRESHSFVDAQEVIGRDDDKKAILDILDQHRDQHVCVVPIVGIGGLGKTTLTQAVYNEIEKQFDLSLWVCVSDNFDIKEIVIKLLKSATNTEPQNLELDQLQKQLRSQLTGKKYLLVLDDVWNDDAEKWRQLSALLKLGREGSKVLLTCRSMEVAKIMSTIPNSYHLKGLSEKNSLALFTKTAFAPGQEDKDPELLSIGEKIVKNCANVPLAIRTLGSLLRGKEKHVWLNLEGRSLADIPENGNQVMTILEVSYHHLKSPLKNCFAYCALFPKDYNFNKETLIKLWMAQGFVIPAHDSQSLEEAGEEYFLTLLQRCFFQDVELDEWGNIESCKMHDLMHDLALKVAGLDCKMAKLGEMDFDDRIHHLSIGYHLTLLGKIPSTVLNLKLLRTFLLPVQKICMSAFSKSILHQLLSSYGSLRVLDLHDLGVASLPSSIGNLMHLRYMDLSGTSIEALPNLIVELQNLQTLKLFSCQRLKRLPTDLKKLASLRSLDVSQCRHLTQMPSGLGVLTSLHSLPFFMVNYGNSQVSKWETSTARLLDLKNLNNLKGSLEIKINRELKDPTYEAKEANLSSKDALMELGIQLNPYSIWELSAIKQDEAILEGLKPHRNLKKLDISGYKGEKFPSWAVKDNLCTTLPNLVEVGLSYVQRCQQLPSFSQLPFLKRLRLFRLESVEYMESSVTDVPSLSKEALFFPSLEELELDDMNELKGWWREVEEVVGDDEASSPVGVTKLQHQSGKSFPNLSRLLIQKCPNLKSVPHCPKVGELKLVDVNEETLLVLKMAATSVDSSSTSSGSSSNLKTLQMDDVEALISLPKESLSHLATLKVSNCSQLVNESRLEELFKNLNSLSCLEFIDCPNLRCINCGLEHLTALEKLVLRRCRELDLSPSQDVEDFMPWRALKNLRYLELASLDKLVALPNGLQHLTNLHSLHLSWLPLVALPEWITCFSSLVEMELWGCSELASLPEGFRKLTKLNQLRITYCPGLTKRCQDPTGEDWPKIHHVPLVFVSHQFF